jgi:Rieske 2Fe-2S protein
MAFYWPANFLLCVAPSAPLLHEHHLIGVGSVAMVASAAWPAPEPRRRLDPFPTGWYALFSSELAAGALLHGRYFGEELVVFRTEAGRAVAMDAYCPHMGAHLGHGGEVRGETLRCPFHGFCFDFDIWENKR